MVKRIRRTTRIESDEDEPVVKKESKKVLGKAAAPRSQAEPVSEDAESDSIEKIKPDEDESILNKELKKQPEIVAPPRKVAKTNSDDADSAPKEKTKSDSERRVPTKKAKLNSEDDEPAPKGNAKAQQGHAKRSTKLMPPPPKSTQTKNEAKYEPAETASSSPKPLTKRSGSLASESASDVEEGVEEDEEDDEEEEKPAVAAKAREKLQTTLKGGHKDPYPDWKPGEPVPYAALCTTFSLIELTSKRLIITQHCALFLRQVLRLTPGDLLPTVFLMVNKLAADYAGIELGIGESLIMKAIGESTGRSLQVIKQDQKEIGDLGLVAVKSRSKQPTMFKPKPLTVAGVLESLIGIATVQGNGAQGRKVAGIKKLLSAADGHKSGNVDITVDKGGSSEAKYIVRFLEGKLRLGLAEKTVLVSLAQAMVFHEVEAKGGLPSTDQLAKGESILKQIHRYVSAWSLQTTY